MKPQAGDVGIEEAHRSWPRIREGMDGARRNGDESSWAGAMGLVADPELELAVEDVERIDVQLVEVRPSTLVLGPAFVHEEVHLLPRALDEELAVLLFDQLTLAGPGEDRLHVGEL